MVIPPCKPTYCTIDALRLEKEFDETGP
jgi:hypothetical protein